MKIKASISMAKCYGSDGVSINVQIQDSASGIQFFDGDLTLEAFAAVITGHGHVEMDAEVRGLQHVGKRRVREERSVTYPFRMHSRKELEAWLIENAQEPGWILDWALRSQRSVEYCADEVTKLHYSVYKFVEDTCET